MMRARAAHPILGACACLMLACGGGAQSGPMPDAAAAGGSADATGAVDAPADAPSVDQAIATDATASEAQATDSAPSADGGSSTDAPPDAQRPSPIEPCGQTVCTLYTGDAPVCCTTDLGVTGTCVPFATSCSSGRFDCAGAENCVSTAVCCYVQGGTLCIPGTCDPYPVVCHGSSECDGGTCCPLAEGSSFKSTASPRRSSRIVAAASCTSGSTLHRFRNSTRASRAGRLTSGSVCANRSRPKRKTVRRCPSAWMPAVSRCAARTSR